MAYSKETVLKKIKELTQKVNPKNYIPQKSESPAFKTVGPSPDQNNKLRKRASFYFPRLKQLKYLPHFISQPEKTALQIFTGLIIVSLLFLIIRFYQTRVLTVPSPGGEYIEATVGNPQFINPILGVTSDTDKDLTYLIYSGLLKYNKKQELVPDLSSNFTVSPDQKNYTFYLKKNVLWHDGQPLTAADIVFTIKTIQNPDFKSPLYVSFKGIAIEKIDVSTVKFILTEPFAPFLSILTVGIMPEHLWSNVAPEQFQLTAYNLKPIGTGPYKFKSLSKDRFGLIKTYSLVSNSNYYLPQANIANLDFKFFSSFDEAISGLTNKTADGLSYLPKNLNKELKNLPRLRLKPLRLPQYSAVFFNQNNNQFLKNKTIRQALTYAINKEKILSNALAESGEIIHGPILPGFIGYNPNIRQYQYDPKKSQQLLKDVGFVSITADEYKRIKDNQDQSATQNTYLQKGAEILEIDLVAVDQSENQKTAEIIRDSWQELGVKVNLKIITPAAVKETIKSRNYQALLYGIITGFDPDPYPFWHSSQNQDPGLNLAVFSNPEVDRVLEDARKTSDEKTRQDKYTHFQNILIEELPAIFLYSPTYTYVLPEKNKGFEITRLAQPSDRFIGIEDWYIKTKRVIKW